MLKSYSFISFSGQLTPTKLEKVLKIIYLAVVLMVGIAFSACGYRFAGGGRLAGGTRTVFVDMLENRTAETGIENTFTTDLRYEFVRNRMSAARDKAEGILSGVIRSIRVETISRSSQTVSQERRVTARLDLNLIDPGGKVLWSVKAISDSEAYPATAGDKTSIDFNKRAAITRLSKRIAESVFYRLTEDF